MFATSINLETVFYVVAVIAIVLFIFGYVRR